MYSHKQVQSSADRRTLVAQFEKIRRTTYPSSFLKHSKIGRFRQFEPRSLSEKAV